MDRRAIELYCEQATGSLAVSQRMIDSLHGRKRALDDHLYRLSKLWPDFGNKYLSLHRELLLLKKRSKKHFHSLSEDAQHSIEASFTKITLAESVIDSLLFHSDISDFETLKIAMSAVLEQLQCIHRQIKVLKRTVHANLPKD